MGLLPNPKSGNPIPQSELSAVASAEAEDPFRWVSCPTSAKREEAVVLRRVRLDQLCALKLAQCSCKTMSATAALLRRVVPMVIDRRSSRRWIAGGIRAQPFCHDRQKSGLVPACAKFVDKESSVRSAR